MDFVPQRLVNNGLMFAGVGCPLVHGFTEIQSISEQPIEGALVKGSPLFANNALSADLLDQHRGRAQLHEALEDTPQCRGLLWVHTKLAIIKVVTEGNVPTHPKTPFAACRELVTNTCKVRLPVGHFGLPL